MFWGQMLDSGITILFKAYYTELVTVCKFNTKVDYGNRASVECNVCKLPSRRCALCFYTVFQSGHFNYTLCALIIVQP